MDRQVSIQPHQNLFHVIFHNYMGPFEGRQIGKWIGLDEIEAPIDGDQFQCLSDGEFYLWHEMDRHPDLHALVGASRLAELAKAVEHFHARVTDGSDFLPPLPETERPHYADVNYIAQIEESHKSVFDKGPRAIFQAFLVRAIPALIILAAVIIYGRHTGDHRTQVSLDRLFAASAQDLPVQSSIGRFVDPDYSQQFRTKITSIRYMDRDRVILLDGDVLEFRGIGLIEPVLLAAQNSGTMPVVNADAHSGLVRVLSIDVNDERFGQGTTLHRIAQLPTSAERPARGNTPDSGQFFVLETLPEPGTSDWKSLDGERISLEGSISRNDDGLQLITNEGTQLSLVADRGLGNFLDVFGDGREKLIVDLLFRADASSHIRSISVQNYHIVAR